MPWLSTKEGGRPEQLGHSPIPSGRTQWVLGWEWLERLPPDTFVCFGLFIVVTQLSSTIPQQDLFTGLQGEMAELVMASG